jgi:hypothetical protein
MKTILTIAALISITFSGFSQITPPVAAADPEENLSQKPVTINELRNLIVDDYAETTAGVAVEIAPLANDTSSGTDTLVIFGVAYARKGRILDMSDSVFTYVPYANAKGVDSLQYMARTKENPMPVGQAKIYIDIIDQHYYDSLTVNNINAGVNASGTMFSRVNEVTAYEQFGAISPHFRYPAGEMKNTIFTTAFWIGGMDGNDDLHLAAQRYKQVGFDFQAGPVSDAYDVDHYLKYGRTWKVSREEVEYHRDHYWQEGYEPIEPIASWPGNGDPGHGEALKLAPFHDENNDGYYHAMDGDYPLIRGDLTIFFMFNDDRLHTETSGEGMKVEIHAMVYGYDVPLDTALYNTVFVHYDLYNRSEETYHETYVGFFTDFDVGYPWDDFVGCDVQRGSFYGYNGLDVDGNGAPDAYGENPPAQSLTVLAGPFIDPDGEDNPGGGCDGSVNGLHFGNGVVDDERHGLTTFMYFSSGGNTNISDPSLAEEYYTYLQGLWKNGDSLMYGANGHPVTGSVGPACRYMFPGDSDPLNWGTYCQLPNGGYNQDGKYWTDPETGNLPYDRRGLGSLGPFTFAPGDVQEIELAFVVGRGENGPMSSVEQMQRQIDSLIAGVRSGEVIVPNQYLAVKEHKDGKPQMMLYPNPTTDRIHIKWDGKAQAGDIYRIYNMQGQLVREGKLRTDIVNTLHTADLFPGLYLLVVHGKKEIFSGRFIKN